jgi:hypothetical protein
MAIDFEAFARATEDELAKMAAPAPQTVLDLQEFITTMTTREQTYGTCVYAVSLCALATFNYVAHQLGITGFQASCADLDIMGKRRDLIHGFYLLDANNLL